MQIGLFTAARRFFNSISETPLQLAARTWLWILLWVCPAGAGATSPTPLPPDFLKTPLHSAAEFCHLGVARNELAELALARRKVQLNLLDGQGYTPLAYAAESGCLPVARLLIEAGAAVDATEEHFPVTPLLRAAWQRHAEVIDYLLSRGADVNFRSRLSDNPLMAALMGSTFPRGPKGDRDGAVKALLGHGANVSLPGRNGWTPLMLAVFQQDAALVRWLLDAGADVSARDEKGKTALDYAKERGEPAVTKVLSQAQRATKK